MRVGTHNGEFHADDVFAVAALRFMFGVGNVEVVRSRDAAVLATCDLRVDVGGRSDPATGDFDHHQRGGAGTRDNGVPYAAFGLVWRQYGANVCAGNLEMARIVEGHLVQSVDAADCGFSLSTGKTVEGLGHYTVSSAISGLNPEWHEYHEPEDFGRAFEQAVEMACTILGREIMHADGVVMARQNVRQAIAAAADSRLIVLEAGCPWQEIVRREAPEALFVAFPIEMGAWRLQCVPSALGSFAQRKPLPESWAGKLGQELAELTGVSDVIFCHSGRFIAGAQTREGVLRLAELALAE